MLGVPGPLRLIGRDHGQLPGSPPDLADRSGDVAYPASGDRGDACFERLSCGCGQARVCWVLVADLD